MDETFCPLCGVIIDTWQNEFAMTPSEPLSWLADVRAIKTTRHMLDPVLTGVGWLGWLMSHVQVFAPHEKSAHYANITIRAEENQDVQQWEQQWENLQASFGANDLGCSPYDDRWCFAMHDACWELLCDHVVVGSDERVDPSRIASHLFALLYNTPVSGETTPMPGHDYGHAAQFQDWKASGYDYIERVNGSGYSFLTDDVREKFQFNHERLRDAAPASFEPASRGDYSTSDILCRLPNEIWMLILASLSSVEVCRVRLASRYVADVATPGALSQRFWASRFASNREMGFAFAGPSYPNPNEPIDWRALYSRAKGALKSDLFPGFRNRRRIWRSLQDLSKQVGIRLANDIWLSAFPNPMQPGLPKGASLGQTACAEASLPPGVPGPRPERKELTLSCRLFERQSILWPHNIDAKDCELRSSSVYSNGRRYICGLRFSLPAKSYADRAMREAGFIDRRGEDRVPIRLQGSLENLDVAMTAKGVTGLRFHMRNARGAYSVSVGDMGVECPESGIGRLARSNNARCVGLVLGFDACKLISVSLIEQQSPTNGYGGLTLSRGLELVELWNPRIPEARPVWPWLYYAPVQHFNLCLNMDFGGSDGRLLQSLTRIDFLVGSFPAVFLGMSFVYDGASEQTYGRTENRESIEDTTHVKAIQQSFPIDGPHDEHLSSPGREMRDFAFTAADLVGLRKIRVSVDKEGQGHITGLWLEYHDSNVPVILGQWIDEFGCLTIAPDDRLTEVTTWHGYTSTHWRENIGPVKKLVFGTASGNRKEFLDPLLSGNLVLRYRENPYENLTAIVWGSYHEEDRARVLYSPKPGIREDELIIEENSFLSSSRLVREKIFMEETLDDGRPNRVTGIEVSFKENNSELSGLPLIYEHGSAQSLGTRGRSPHTIQLCAGEKLTRMEIGVQKPNKAVFIKFLTNSDRTLHSSESKGRDSTQQKTHRVVFNLHPSCPKQPSVTGKKSKMYRGFPEDAVLGPIFDTADATGGTIEDEQEQEQEQEADWRTICRR
ncbi:Uu.00g112640.m01.CDS01 [Anthostomella pinea]|uniref:Uu.00g112640.m01.CDS01 n=1 Tax=Anthostomella pinea TaxID=933095 RepID=A0AAI8YGD7_9PEZI|nr:Uu.00g112640.m01.CDS01 [Anthostomella pinea]